MNLCFDYFVEIAKTVNVQKYSNTNVHDCCACCRCYYVWRSLRLSVKSQYMTNFIPCIYQAENKS